MIEKIWINGFRNLNEFVLDCDGASFFFIFGANNQGKSNFLEAIYFLCNGVSPFASDVENLVGFGREEAYLGADISGQRVMVKLTAEGRKIVKDRRSVFCDYIGADVIRMFQDYPDTRRKELNRFCGLAFPEYKKQLRTYEAILKQRNQLLLQSPTKSQLEVWTEPLVAGAEPIFESRKKALEILQGELKKLFLAIHLPFENVNLKYISKAEPDFRKKLAENWEKELRAGMTLYGPHRDDFACEIDGRSLYSFFSRGINRAVAFLIKLAQVNYLAKEPVLLLDDVFAELDSEMKKKMACALTQNMQVFYATVLEEDRRLFGASTALRVENGNIVA